MNYIGDYPARSRYTGAAALQYVGRRVETAKWHREQRAVEAMIAVLPRGSLVLDAPVGPGRFLAAYASAGLRVCGMDISGDMLRQAGSLARGGRPPRLIQGDIERLPLDDGAVDYVVCTRFLNWVPAAAAERVLAEFARVARRGAILHVRVVHPVAAGERLQVALGAARHHPARVVARLRRNVRAWLGRDAGYVLHRAADFDAALARHRATVETIATVGRRLSYLHGERHDLRVYRLRYDRASRRGPGAAPDGRPAGRGL